jgi:hypothetical protein
MAGLLYSDLAAAKLRSGLPSTVPESGWTRHTDWGWRGRRYAWPVTDGIVKDLARTAESNHTFQFLARTGVAVIGLLHLLIGAIAITVATSSGREEVDGSGALRRIADTPGGVVLLWAIIVGMLALGVWQVVQLFLVPGRSRRRRWGYRVIELGKGAVYFFIAALTFAFARGETVSTARITRDFSSTLLDSPGGPIVMVLIGIVTLIVGVAFVVRGASTGFTEDIRVPVGYLGRATVALGVLGFVAKGIALAVVGVLFVIAAFTSESWIAAGLDSALTVLIDLPSGAVIPVVVGLGLSAYGVFFLVRARLVLL